MRIYTYAIVDSNGQITSPINGLEGIGVYNIPYRDIGIVVSEGQQIHPVRDKTLKADGRPAAGGTVSNGVQDITQEHILKHEEVVEKLMESFTVLPVSFLTLFKKEEDVLSMMREYYSDFRENLDRLCNKVEFGIKIIWPGETIKNRIIEASKKFNPSTTLRIDGERPFDSLRSLRVVPSEVEGRSRTINADVTIPDNLPPHQRFWCGGSPGKSFAKEKFEKYKIDKEFAEEADRCIALLDDFFSRNACEKKLEKLKSDNLLLNAYYLVGKEKQVDFKEAFERTRSAPGDLKFLLSGPWPPYNFIVLAKNADMFNRKSTNQNLAGKNTL